MDDMEAKFAANRRVSGSCRFIGLVQGEEQ